MLINPYVFAAGGGGGGAGLAWSRTDLSPAGVWTFSSSDTVADEATSANAAIRTVSGKSATGKWYWELVISSVGGSGGFNAFAAFLNETDSVTNAAGLPYSLRTTGASNGLTSPGGFGTGDHVCFAMDLAAGKAWVRVNGGSWAGGGDPAAGTTPSASGLSTARTWYPAAASDNTGLNHRFALLSTAAACAYTVPSGFTCIGD